MVAVIAVGVVCGVLGFLPLYASFWLAKRMSVLGSLGYVGSLFLGLSASFAILFAAFLIGRIVVDGTVLVLVFSEVVSFLVAATIFGFVMLGKR